LDHTNHEEIEMIAKSGTVSDRRDFGALANFHGATVAVEVGVDQGVFTKAFLSQWRGSRIYLVDPLGAHAGYYSNPRDWDMQSIIQGIRDDMHRCRFIRAASSEGPGLIWQRDQKFIGFVYIDAIHTHESVTKDIQIWWPLLRSGGVLAGHDWDIDGVAGAVTEFHDQNPGIDVWTTHEKISPSWYILKP
jgi:hypothetical protein